MKKAIKVDESMLRELIQSELNESTRSEAPTRVLMSHLEGAKKALVELYQSAADDMAADRAQALMNGINKMLNFVKSMPR